MVTPLNSLPATNNDLELSEALELGRLIDSSPYKFEVSRMLLQGKSLLDIAVELRDTFGFDVDVQELYAFQGKFYEQYKPQVARITHLERVSSDSVVAQSEQFNLLSQLTDLLSDAESRIIRIKGLPDAKQSAQMEQALVKLYNLKKDLAESIGEILEETGIESKLRRLLEQVAKLVVQCFLPHIPAEIEKGKLLQQFSKEMDSLVRVIIRSGDKEP